MVRKNQGKHAPIIKIEDEDYGSSHNVNVKSSRAQSDRVLRPRTNKTASAMTVNTRASDDIEDTTTPSASGSFKGGRPSKRKKYKTIDTKIEEIVHEGIRSHGIIGTLLDGRVTPSDATVGTLSIRSSRLLSSVQYPKVFEPDMILCVYDEDIVKEVPWLSDDLQGRALLQLEALLRTHEKLRGNETRYKLSIRTLQPIPIKLKDAFFDVHSWLRTWCILFDLSGDKVSYEGACKIKDLHWQVMRTMLDSEADESNGVKCPETRIDVTSKRDKNNPLRCQDGVASVPFKEKTLMEPAAANMDNSVSLSATATVNGSRIRSSPLQTGQASLSSAEPNTGPWLGQSQVPLQLPKAQLLLLNRKRPSNVAIVHEKRVEGLRPTFVYFKKLSDWEKATVIGEIAKRWIADECKELGAKEVKSLSYLITTMHDFLARQTYTERTGLQHDHIFDEVGKMPTRFKKIIFMMWAKDWIGTTFNEPEPAVASSLRLTMMSMISPSSTGTSVAS